MTGLQQRLGTCAAFLLAVWGSSSLVQSADPPVPPTLSEVQRVLDASRADGAADQQARPLTIVLLADKKDHGPGEHDYPRWQARWALLIGGASASSEQAANLDGPDVVQPELAQGAPRVRVVTARPWPTEEQWSSADVVVAFCYMAWDAQRVADARKFLQRGGGLVLIHSATWTQPEPSLDIAELVGVGGFTKYRHGPIKLTISKPDHPICTGLPNTVLLEDESYYPPTPPIDAQRVNVLATCAEEPAEGETTPSAQPMFWTCESGQGRVFGCVLGHNNFTFDHPYFRLLLLRGIAWSARENPHRFDTLSVRSARMGEE